MEIWLQIGFDGQHVKIFPDHAYKPLLSLGQLSDAGYTFQGDHNYMILTHPGHQSLFATRFLSSGMYLMSLTHSHSALPSLTFPSMPTLQACSTRFNKVANYLANNAFSMAKNPDLAMYYHRAAFSPVPTTFITAINNGNFLHGRDLQQSSYQSIYQKSLQRQKATTS